MPQTAITDRSPHSLPYKRHRPEHTLLYQIIERHYPEFRDVMAMQGKSLPLHVQQQFCGLPQMRTVGTRIPAGAMYRMSSRYGSALNLNVHFYMLFPDGVYTTTPWGKSRFHRTHAPDRQELTELVHTISHRVAGFLEREGVHGFCHELKAALGIRSGKSALRDARMAAMRNSPKRGDCP